MEDPTTVGRNFEERKKRPWHEFGRVVTIFPLPMSEDRRAGIKISASEYVEPFIVHAGFVTVQTYVDKGTYWVMCRETYRRKAHGPPVDLSTYKPFLGRDDMQRLWFYYEEEIDETRHLLHTRF